MQETRHEFSEEDIKDFEPMMKVGLLATINEEGLPHLTMLSSLMASNPTKMTWGQFTEGTSFQNVQRNPNIGFLIMSLDKNLWRGKGTFTHIEKSGKDYDFYNNSKMFRYNAYFGIHTVFYMDLLEQSGKSALPMTQIVLASIKTMLSKYLSFGKGSAEVFTEWTTALMDKIGNLKFLAYIGADGFPIIIPVIQAMTSGKEHIIFSPTVYAEEFVEIPVDADVAVFGLSLNMTDVLLRGKFKGIRRIGPHRCGEVKVDWVYSPMPPNPQQIYPPLELSPIRTFD